MKLYPFSFLLSFSFVAIAFEVVTPPIHATTVYITQHLNPTATNNVKVDQGQNASLDQNLDSKQQLDSVQSQHNEQSSSQTMSMDVDFAATFNSWIGAAQESLSAHKGSILKYAALSGYALLCYHVLRGNNYLGSRDLWSSWHMEKTIQELFAIPQQEIGQELLLEIQRRYTMAGSPVDFISPLAHFIADINDEVAMITFYQNLNWWLTRSYLSYIFPIAPKRYAATGDRLARLAYIKNIFSTWAAEYKIELNQPAMLLKNRA